MDVDPRFADDFDALEKLLEHSKACCLAKNAAEAPSSNQTQIEPTVNKKSKQTSLLSPSRVIAQPYKRCTSVNNSNSAMGVRFQSVISSINRSALIYHEGWRT